MRKKQIREQIMEELKVVTEMDYQEWSSLIAQTLYGLEVWKNADTIGMTISRGKEVYTRAIIEKGWEQHKQMVVPKCDPITKDMTFRVIETFEQLEVVYFGLEEPIENITTSVVPTDIDLLIVPGLAFDIRGNRLGFGGGYYDRFLNKYVGPSISLAFQLQVIESIPVDNHDRAVNMIITNKEVFRC